MSSRDLLTGHSPSQIGPVDALLRAAEYRRVAGTAATANVRDAHPLMTFIAAAWAVSGRSALRRKPGETFHWRRSSVMTVTVGLLGFMEAVFQHSPAGQARR